MKFVKPILLLFGLLSTSACQTVILPPWDNAAHSLERESTLATTKVSKNRDDARLITSSVATPLALSDQKPQSVDVIEEPPKNLWVRLQRGFAMPRLEMPASESFAQHFAAKNHLAKIDGRVRRYLFYIIEELEKRGMPTELALLPVVESAMNPQSRSPVGAAGPWQFMPATGKRFDMRISHLVDDRKNVMQSTKGALDYLQKLYAQFGDWHLALAAYNWGEGSVQKAINRNLAAGLPTDFIGLIARMPAETRNYVPQLEALKRIVANPEYGATLPFIVNAPYFQEVAVDRDIDVSLLLRLTGMSSTDFFALNPSVRAPVMMAAATPRLLLPMDAANRFAKQLAEYRGKTSSWTVIKLSNAKRIETIAKEHGGNASALREVNSVPSGMKVAAGSSVLVPTSRQSVQVNESTVSNAVMVLTPDVERVQLSSKKGETLPSIAQRLNLNISDLRRWNSKLSANKRLAKGQKYIVFVHPDLATRLKSNSDKPSQTKAPVSASKKIVKGAARRIS